MGYVYFIAENPFNDRVKIGMSVCVKERLPQLQVGNASELVVLHTIEIEKDKMSILESSFHKMYKDKHIRGEWFNLTADDVKNIQAMNIQNNIPEPVVRAVKSPRIEIPIEEWIRQNPPHDDETIHPYFGRYLPSSKFGEPCNSGQFSALVEEIYGKDKCIQTDVRKHYQNQIVIAQHWIENNPPNDMENSLNYFKKYRKTVKNPMCKWIFDITMTDLNFIAYPTDSGKCWTV